MIPDHATRSQDYWAFISYRHADNKDKENDRAWASWLHQEIERYQIPAELIGKKNQRDETIPENLYPIFRDEESLPADADLGSSITNALDKSKFLVVLCSPKAVESKYVAQEIEHFKATGKSDRILAVIIDGEPGDKEKGCLPGPLLNLVAPDGKKMEPIAADLRLPDGTEGYTSAETYKHRHLAGRPKKQARRLADDYDERLQLMKLKTIAGVLGVPLETLRDRDKAYQLTLAKKRQRILAGVIATVSIFAILATIAGIFAWKNQKIAQQKATEEKEARLEVQKQIEAREALLAKNSLNSHVSAIRAYGKNEWSLYYSYLAQALRSNPKNQAASLHATSNLIFEPLNFQLIDWFYSPDPAESFHHSQNGNFAIRAKNSIRIFSSTYPSQEIWSYQFPSESPKNDVYALSLHPNKPWCAFEVRDAESRKFLVIDYTTNTTLWKQPKTRGYVTASTFSPGGTSLLIATSDKTLTLVSTTSFKPVWTTTPPRFKNQDSTCFARQPQASHLDSKQSANYCPNTAGQSGLLFSRKRPASLDLQRQ